MKTYKILFLDIDGTIMKPDDTIEDSTRSAIRAVQQKGLDVVLATGRPLHEISELAKELNVDSFIGYNGAYAVCKRVEIYNQPMSKASAANLIDTALKNGHQFVAYTDEKNYLFPYQSAAMDEFIKTFHLHKNELYSEAILGSVLGMTLITEDHHGNRLYSLEDGLHLSQVNVEHMRHCYDVIRDTVNKGAAVKAFLQYLNIPVESSIAFGDGMNDKEMLQFVGEGFAMGNCHPDLRTFAKHFTTDVHNSGIFNGLMSLGLLD
ncbi:HAD family hydrolase [Peribacillus sp. SCS-155]|uniref:HAD family hydrolase n=1 Tax=Peribacillus sedimenti TaxID=3115297 RepID=UPI0039068581